MGNQRLLIADENSKKHIKMIQPILSNSTNKFTDICISYNKDSQTYSAYLGLALLETVPADKDSIQFKMLAGRCRNAGAKICDLHEHFKLDPRSIKNYSYGLKSNDANEVARIFAGKSHNKKISPEIIEFVRDFYEQKGVLGKNYRQQIIEKVQKIFDVDVGTSSMSAIFKSFNDERKNCERNKENSEVTLLANDQEKNVDKSQEIDDQLLVKLEDEILLESYAESSGLNSLNRDCIGQLGSDLSINKRPSVQVAAVFQFLQMSSFNRRESRTLLHHAGLVLFCLDIHIFSNIQRQFIHQLLQGAVNIEQSKTLCQSSLNYFSKIECKTLAAQREMIDAEASFQEVIKLYRLNNNLLSDGPNKGKLFYFDPHTKEYTGALKILKGWCGRTHKVSKVINLDSFHTQSGHPCFIQHYSPFYDMRERFFMSLKLFDELFDEDKRTGRTFVIDRAIYGLESLKRFDKDYLIIWEKGFDSKDVKIDWQNKDIIINFARYRTKNSKKQDDAKQLDNLKINFSCYEEKQWSKLNSFRRIIVKVIRKDRPEIILSVLCSNPDMSVEDVVWAIFNRWLQENDFKYLDVNFGINQLDSRAHSTFEKEQDKFQDRDIASPDYIKKRDELAQENIRFAKHLLKARKAQKKLNDLEFEYKIKSKNQKKEENKKKINKGKLKELRARVKALEKNIDKTKEKLINLAIKENEFDKNIEQLEINVSEMLRKSSRLELLIKGNYSLLNLRRKSYMDALRVCAANLFRKIHLQYRDIYNNYRDDHVQLRMLTRSSGMLIQNAERAEMILWLPGNLQPRVLKSMQVFVKKISSQYQEANQNYLTITLVNGTITQ